MKRRSTTVMIESTRKAVEGVLEDSPSFVTNWPYVVRVSMKDGLKAEIMLPRFIFKFRDVYGISYHRDYNSHIYDGTGERSHLSLVVTLKEWKKGVEAVLELSYSGKGEFWLGKTLEDFVQRIGNALKELSESRPAVEEKTEHHEIAEHVDFSDPMSVANFLAKSRMVHSGLHVIGDNGFFDLVSELRATVKENVLYISGITSDGASSFKVLLNGSRIMAIEYRGKDEVKAVKVEDEEGARKAMEIAFGIKGPYMVNVWVPVGGV